MYDFDGRRVFVSGAARGIGRAIVEEFARRGADVFFSYYQSRDDALELADELSAGDRTVETFQLDVTDYEACRTAVERVTDDGPLHVLVNNAGHLDDGLFPTMRETQWRNVIDVELNGAINLTHAAIHALMRSESASVVNIASVVGVFGNPGQANHSASKAGLLGFTRSVAQEVGRMGVRVNAVSPGLVQTHALEEMPQEAIDEARERTPLGRLARPKDVASAVLFLSSEDAAFISGQNLRVDGGLPSPH